MNTINARFKKKICILALGAESEGVFSVYKNGKLYTSDNFGDLLDSANFRKYKHAVSAYLEKEKIKPKVTMTDLHPLFNSTAFGQELAEKFGAKHIKVQHHIAHIFSSIGDFTLNTKYKIPNAFLGVAADGTGYGLDGNIWGGEAFQIKNLKLKIKNDNLKCKISKTQNLEIIRIGSLEEQIMIGGELAINEPARMVISILSNFLPKNKIYPYIKKHYTKNEFELLYNQLNQGFNCQKTTSTGRVLDAASVLLGFAKNERNYKHEATKLLEANSTIPYDDLELRIRNYESRKILNTTWLFEYLIKNIRQDERRLAATAQQYIAKGFYEIAKDPNSKFLIPNSCFAAGGMANNKIISQYLEKNGVYLSKKIPRGDEGIAIGQIIYCLLQEI